ncbi:hypothetical protein [Geodermatophilus sp. SYSU D00079]
MEPELMTSVGGLVLAVISLGATARQGAKTRRAQHDIERIKIDAQESLAQSQAEAQRQLERYKVELAAEAATAAERRSTDNERERYWIPLRDAAAELWGRIDNLRLDGFSHYLNGVQPRHDVALLSTLYRFARFWGAVENIADAEAHLRLRSENPLVAEALRSVGKTFASDEFGSAFMVWREEQRAIGELIREGGNGLTSRPLKGFATFVGQYDDVFSRWFASLTADLLSTDLESNARLGRLTHELKSLTRLLGVPSQDDPNG